MTIRQDPDVIMAAVKKNGLQLEYADKLLRNNKEIVMEAVQKAGKALRWASQELRNDKEVVLAAIGQVRCVWMCIWQLEVVRSISVPMCAKVCYVCEEV